MSRLVTLFRWPCETSLFRWPWKDLRTASLSFRGWLDARVALVHGLDGIPERMRGRAVPLWASSTSSATPPADTHASHSSSRYHCATPSLQCMTSLPRSAVVHSIDPVRPRRRQAQTNLPRVALAQCPQRRPLHRGDDLRRTAPCSFYGDGHGSRKPKRASASPLRLRRWPVGHERANGFRSRTARRNTSSYLVPKCTSLSRAFTIRFEEATPMPKGTRGGASRWRSRARSWPCPLTQTIRRRSRGLPCPRIRSSPSSRA